MMHMFNIMLSRPIDKRLSKHIIIIVLLFLDYCNFVMTHG